MNFAPLLPAWIILLLTLAVGAAAWLAYRRPSWPAALRALGVVVLVVMLANPIRLEPATKYQPPVLALVLDRSASMATADAPEGATRFAAGSRALEAMSKILDGRYRIQRYQIADTLTPGMAGEAAGEATGDTAYDDLARLVESAPVAVVFASDGGDRGAVAPEAALSAAHIPLFALAVGTTAPALNVAVRLEPISPTAFPGQELTLDAVITASGAANGKSSDVILSDAEGKEIERRTVTLKTETRETFTVAAGAVPGERLWQVRVLPITGEVTTADNDGLAVVQVVDRALRIAVVEGQPYWDTSFAVRAWRRDRQLAVGTLFGVGQRRWKAGENMIDPPTAEKLKNVDVVVVGSHSERLLDAAGVAAITEFVTNGGGLLFLGVADDAAEAPLAALDPLLRRQGRASSVVPQLASGGRALALLPVGSKPLAAVASGLIAGLRPRTEVLIGHDEQPLVVFRRHGAGRVAAVNAEGLWRWSLNADGDGEIAARFWRQLVKSLVHEGQHGVQADRPRYRVGQEAVITAPGPEAFTVRAPDGGKSTLTRAEGGSRLTLTTAGRWMIAQGARQLTIPVDADVREIVELPRRDERLARLAGSTGGEVVEITDAVALAERLGRRADLRVEAPKSIPLVTMPWWLLLFAGLLASEWWLRRRRHGAI